MANAKITKLSTVKMSEAEWLSTRKNTIGGSEAAAIVGLDPWVSPYTLYMRKKDRLAEPETSLPAEFGSFAEEFVARKFEEQTGKRVRKENAIIYNSDYQFAHANIDRKIVGENAGLECKTTSALNLKQFKGGEFPAKFYVQCMHYMLVCGFDRMYLACLVGNSKFLIFTIERDEAEIRALAAAEMEFYALMQNDTPPEVSAWDCDAETLSALYPESKEETLVLFRDRDKVFEQLEEASRRKKEAENDIKLFQNILKADLGDNEAGATDNYRCSWKTQYRSGIDTERLFAEHPEINKDDYTTTTQSRVFRYSKLSRKED